MKKALKTLFWPFIYLGMRMLFPKFKNKSYYTLRVVLMGIRQKFSRNKRVKWPVHFTSLIIDPKKINPGTKAPGFSMGCFIDGRNGIEVGENVWIGPRVSIISQNHDINDYTQYMIEKPIVIGRNSLLTANCVILPGVELGEHTVVAAGAVVTQSFTAGNQVVGGTPAKVLKQLAPYQS